jgi:hypothetical protein
MLHNLRANNVITIVVESIDFKVQSLNPIRTGKGYLERVKRLSTQFGQIGSWIP